MLEFPAILREQSSTVHTERKRAPLDPRATHFPPPWKLCPHSFGPK